MNVINLNKSPQERLNANKHKFFKVAHMKELEQLLANGEITYSRMVELINELAYDYYLGEKLIGSNIDNGSGIWTNGNRFKLK